MKRTSFVRYMAAATLLFPLTFTGCGGGGSDATAKNSETPNNSATAQAPTVVAGAETECGQSVAIFLDSLRRGDERAANAVITSKAREEMAKCEFGLQPLGTPEGQFQIGRVVFPYPDNAEVALVECTWMEPATADEAATNLEIVCEVHKELEGWRISGMGVTMNGTEEAVLLDFEDSQSLTATLGGTAPPADAPAPSNQSTNMAAQPSLDLPALPSYPNVPQQQNNDSPPIQQIAFPPLNQAPINR